MASLYHIREHTIAASHIREYARATSNSQDEQLSLSVKQYTPKDNPNPQHGDITIIAAHANGFPKELYEPLWGELHKETKRQGLRIRSIWMSDIAWQGKSGILNADKLGNDPSWFDGARDIQHMINHFRMPRPLVAVGHSFGGNMLVNVALSHPRLFSTVVLLDPVISQFASNPGTLAEGPATMSTYRRDVWPSRAEAAKSFKKSPFYQAWDERVLDKWIEHGLRNVDGKEEVTLSTTKHQEVFTFLRPSWAGFDPKSRQVVDRAAVPDLDATLHEEFPVYPFYRPESPITWARLPNLRPSVLYIFGGKSNLSPPQLIREKMEMTGTGIGGSGGAKEGRVKGVTSKEHGHLIAQEAPGLCAREASVWIKSEMERWWKEEKEFEEWSRKTKEEKTTISEERKVYTGKPAKPGKPKSKI
ncbi:alpha/beta hydrolase family protein [Sarocladium implicatum]|nr:alpha/beta hydrolase family protein [Sarocladium implicatum]